MCGFISGLYPVPLIYISVFVPVPYCLDYCSFVVYFEVREPESSISGFLYQDCFGGASLVVQWLTVRLPMQGTWVHAPVQEDPTCRGAAGRVSRGR